jgi:hypothetical protein
MTFIANKPFNITAFAIAAIACAVLHGSMLMGFDQLASNGHKTLDASTQVAKVHAAPRTVTLEPVLISSRRA